jgi:hypothetical protein
MVGLSPVLDHPILHLVVSLCAIMQYSKKQNNSPGNSWPMMEKQTTSG